jgi:hypothetical protein
MTDEMFRKNSKIPCYYVTGTKDEKCKVVVYPICPKCSANFISEDEKNFVCKCGYASNKHNTFRWRKGGICIIEC